MLVRQKGRATPLPEQQPLMMLVDGPAGSAEQVEKVFQKTPQGVFASRGLGFNACLRLFCECPVFGRRVLLHDYGGSMRRLCYIRASVRRIGSGHSSWKPSLVTNTRWISSNCTGVLRTSRGVRPLSRQ